MGKIKQLMIEVHNLGFDPETLTLDEMIRIADMGEEATMRNNLIRTS
jgi:hypothetical protein